MNDHALFKLATMVAAHVEYAPGLMEKRLVLMRGFARAHRLNPAVTDDPDLALLDSIICEPGRPMQKLLDLWKHNGNESLNEDRTRI